MLQLLTLLLFSIWDTLLESLKELGVRQPCFENIPTTKVDGNLDHTPYNLSMDTYAIKFP